jgi:hypothetical protein
MFRLSRLLDLAGQITWQRHGKARWLRPAPRQPIRRVKPQLEELEDRTVPTLLGKQLFPSDYPWNQKITNAPVASISAAVINHIGGTTPFHPDFGQDPLNGNPMYGIPYNVVHGTQAKINVIIDAYPGESDVVAAPIPANAVIEGDFGNGPNHTTGYVTGGRGDSHMIVWDQDNNIAYEFYHATRPGEFNAFTGKTDATHWHADQETVWDMKTDTFRTLGITSVDAAGLSVLAGLTRPDEGLTIAQGGQGVITHALRFTLDNSIILNQYIYPGSHKTDNPPNNPTNTDPSRDPPMGARFRLKASVDISQMNPEAKIIAQAMKDYGLILADNGSNMYVSGAAYSVNASNNFALTWDDNDIQDSVHGLKSLTASDFEMVDLTPQVSSVNASSGAAGTTVTITGKNFSGAAGRLQVLFGNNNATSVTFLSDTQITAVVPAGSGTVDVRVISGITGAAANDTNSNTGNGANVEGSAAPGGGPIFGYGISAISAADQFTYTAPTVTGIAFNDGVLADMNAFPSQRSMITQVVLTFNTAVTVASGAITVNFRDVASPGWNEIVVVNGSGTNTITLTFTGGPHDPVTGGSLEDGNYRVTATASGITQATSGQAMASNYTSNFVRLFGDILGDQPVGNGDALQFRKTFGLSKGAAGFVAAFAFDGGTTIGNFDALQFRKRFGTSPPLPTFSIVTLPSGGPPSPRITVLPLLSAPASSNTSLPSGTTLATVTQPSSTSAVATFFRSYGAGVASSAGVAGSGDSAEMSLAFSGTVFIPDNDDGTVSIPTDQWNAVDLALATLDRQ